MWVRYHGQVMQPPDGQQSLIGSLWPPDAPPGPPPDREHMPVASPGTAAESAERENADISRAPIYFTPRAPPQPSVPKLGPDGSLISPRQSPRQSASAYAERLRMFPEPPKPPPMPRASAFAFAEPPPPPPRGGYLMPPPPPSGGYPWPPQQQPRFRPEGNDEELQSDQEVLSLRDQAQGERVQDPRPRRSVSIPDNADVRVIAPAGRLTVGDKWQSYKILASTLDV